MALERAFTRMLGRQRSRALGAWLLLIAVGAALAFVATRFALEPLLAAAGADTGARKAAALVPATLVAVPLALAFALWWRGVVRPLRALRAHLRRRRKRLSRTFEADVEALRGEHEKRAEQLNAMLQMNRNLRERLTTLSAEQQAARRIRDALIAATHDATVLVDDSGAVVGVSPPVSALLHSAREDLLGRRFEDAIPLFQHGAERLRDHPLGDLVGRVLHAGSGIPQIQQAMLINCDNEPVPVLVTVGTVLDSGGRTLGATVRLTRTDTPVSEPTARLEVSLGEADLGGWATRLLSREPFDRRLDELIVETRNVGSRHMLLYLRVDDLERINDQSGYWAGEQALWHAAKNFALALVDAGTGYRVSNNRFATLLIGSDQTRALEIAERIRAHAQANELVWDGKRIACTISAAVLPVDRDVPSRADLLGAAETLLAEGRRRGGNCVLHKVPDEAAKVRRRDDQAWLDWLLPRLDTERAHLISQESRSLAPTPAKPLLEFFIRVEDDDGVWLEPGHYLPAIERLQKSHLVDLWVLRHLLETLTANPGLFETHSVAGVNLSPQSILDTTFAASAFEALAASDVPPERVCFEIDEAFAVSQSSVVQRFIEQLRPLGVRFALDRCHTTTGITQLRHLPLDYMKIHPSVTQDIEKDALDRTHLEWICNAAHLLGRKTVAINIESPAALDLLHSAGVDFAQGSAVNKFGPIMT